MSKAAFAGLKAVQEIRFHLCQTSKGSEGVRNFLLKSYKNMKAASPATPILIREASGVEGGIVVRQGTHTSDPAGVLAHRVVEPSHRDPRVAPRRCPPSIQSSVPFV
jgi:NADH dehydrogenase (ubiquinone) 1 alpha subcomplex subunit 2|tara:strand:- start:819 stop:1139 length:321 start_codon:yes stop_codon:yes gene_type:complete